MDLGFIMELEESQAPPNVADAPNTWPSGAVRPPPGGPSRGFLSYEGALGHEVDKWTLESHALGVGQVACLFVSRRLREPIEGVVDSASRPLNLAPWNLRTFRWPCMRGRLAVARDVGSLPEGLGFGLESGSACHRLGLGRGFQVGVTAARS